MTFKVEKKTNQDVLQEKVMKLELALIFLVNSLRIGTNIPKNLLDTVEKLVVSEGSSQGK